MNAKDSLMARTLTAIRWSEWAVGKLCLGYGFVLYAIGLGDIDITIAMSLLGLFLSVGLLGYLLNEWSDRHVDAVVGKRNAFSKRQPYVGIVCLLLVAALLVGAAWLLLSTFLQYMLLLSQTALSWAYSCRPLRLKQRGLIGLVAVVTCQYVLPIGIFLTFLPSALTLDWLAIVGFFIVHGTTLELGHQKFDRERDIRTTVSTFATQVSPRLLSEFYERLLRFEAIAILSTFPYLIIRLANHNGGNPWSFLFVLPVCWVSLFLVITCWRYSRDMHLYDYDPFFGETGNCFDRLYTYYPNAFAPFYLTIVVVALNPTQWGLFVFTTLWTRAAFADKSFRWHYAEVLRLFRPPELFFNLAKEQAQKRLALGYAAPNPPFDRNYRAARARFCSLAKSAGATVESVKLKAEGPSGEPLFVDVATLGDDCPERAVIHVSGTHGVEGFAGSAIQCAFLEQKPSVGAAHAVVLVHVLDPYGMAWLRRVNVNNVDLNRNCLRGFDQVRGVPSDYFIVDSVLNSTCYANFRWLFFLQMAWLALQHGRDRIKRLVASGQYVNPRGLFYGGSHLEEEPEAVFRLIVGRLGHVQSAAVVDVHTGMGKYATASHTWLEHSANRHSAQPSNGDETSGEYPVLGDFAEALERDCPWARWTRVYQEFGTYSSISNLFALQNENLWHLNGNPADLHHRAKTNLLAAFNPDDEHWQRAVLEEGLMLLDRVCAHVFETTSTQRLTDAV